MRAILILPIQRAYNEFDGVQVLASLNLVLPGLTDDEKAGVSINAPVEPITGEPDYIAVWVVAKQAIIDKLAAHAQCLYVIGLNDSNQWVSQNLTGPQRVQIVNKLKSFGYDGGRFGQINAAIQSSQNSAQAAINILQRIFNIGDPSVYYLHDPDVVAVNP